MSMYAHTPTLCLTLHYVTRLTMPNTLSMKFTAVVLWLVGLSRAVQVNVYLSPPQSLHSSLSTGQASFAISRHLGLEAFEPVDLEGESFTGFFDEEQFVGKGASNAVLLSIDENVAKGQS